MTVPDETVTPSPSVSPSPPSCLRTDPSPSMFPSPSSCLRHPSPSVSPSPPSCLRHPSFSVSRYLRPIMSPPPACLRLPRHVSVTGAPLCLRLPRPGMSPSPELLCVSLPAPYRVSAAGVSLITGASPSPELQLRVSVTFARSAVSPSALPLCVSVTFVSPCPSGAGGRHQPRQGGLLQVLPRGEGRGAQLARPVCRHRQRSGQNVQVSTGARAFLCFVGWKPFAACPIGPLQGYVIIG